MKEIFNNKKNAAILVIVILTVGSAIAGLSFRQDVPPPVELAEAYPLAVKALGTNASQYHCVLAMPIQASTGSIGYTNHQTGEWSFNFVNTNHENKIVWVYFDDKTAEVVRPTGF